MNPTPCEHYWTMHSTANRCSIQRIQSWPLPLISKIKQHKHISQRNDNRLPRMEVKATSKTLYECMWNTCKHCTFWCRKGTKLSELSVYFTQDKCFMHLAIYYYRDQFKMNEMGKECGVNAIGENWIYECNGKPVRKRLHGKPIQREYWNWC